MLGTKIEHFLRLGNTADQRTGKRFVSEYQRQSVYAVRAWRHADNDHRAADAEQIQIRIYIVIGRNCIENKVESADERLKISRIACDAKMMCPKRFGINFFRRRGAEYSHLSSHCDRDLNSHVAQAAQAHDADLLAGPDVKSL